MRNYKLKQGINELANVFANNESEAWKKLKNMGFRNRSKIFDLICEDDEYDIYG